MERYSFWLRPWPRWFFCLFVNFVVNSPLLVYAVRIAPGVPFSTTNEARVLYRSCSSGHRGEEAIVSLPLLPRDVAEAHNQQPVRYET